MSSEKCVHSPIWPECRTLEVPMALTSKQFHRIAKALANPRRFEILQRIADCREMACNDLKAEIPITPATLSHHINELSDSGLIELRREGKFMHMQLRRSVWKEYLSRLGKL
jgi:ArsR family transcriptional regulator, arsenate/arsenite/antimonite-responsive transcriptional repressor